MKKKILAVVLAGVMAMSMLTACGGSGIRNQYPGYGI